MAVDVVSATGAPAAIGPYSQAVVARGVIYASGQLPLDPTNGKIVDGDVSAQTARILQNHAAILAAASSDLQHVVRTTVLLKDLSDFAAMNAAYEKAFAGHRPARSTYQVADLPRGARVMIECTAVPRTDGDD